MKKQTKLKDFLISYLGFFKFDGARGHSFIMPKFDLHSFDYLKFAEHELEKNDTFNLMNCIAHLKRAADCQLDTFLYVCNLYNLSNKKNFGFNTKLEFLKNIGILSSRSLTRFNTIRNKMEHYYEIPKISDIEVYYDLVFAIVNVLQAKINILEYYGSDLSFSIEESEDGYKGYFNIQYIYSNPSICVKWELNDATEKIEVDVEEVSDFAFFFKVLFLLGQKECYVNDKYILSQLDT